MKRIFLIGFMGSGKSTVGRNLANALKWKFIDLDTYIEDKQGFLVSEIFSRDGESVFRLMEQQALEEVSKMDNVVIATGGGVPCFFNNMENMKQAGLTMYLKLSPESLLQRLLPARKTRPLIADKSDAELLLYIEKKLEERESFYCQASVVADASATSIEPYLRIIKLYQ